jgi:hypothetical protein
MSQDEPINLKTCHDWRCKPIIPFYLYVERSISTALDSKDFFWFGQLPIELQYRVLRSCDASTLFSLMHTTSTLRTEAGKLFWSQQDTWYRCDAAFFTVMGGSPGPSMTCTKFSKNVQQLDILFTTLWNEFEEAKPDAQIGHAAVPAYNLKWERMSVSSKMLTFWKTIKERFPSVKQVVFSDHFPIEAAENKDQRAPSNPNYVALIRACPPSFDLKAFVCLTNWVRFRYDDIDRLYRLGTGPQVSWELVDDDFTRKVVIPGAKKFEGPVGKFQKLVYHKQVVQARATGKRQVMMDLWIKYELGNNPAICVCPKEECATPFSTLKEWKSHVLTERHDIVKSGSLSETEYRSPQGLDQGMKDAVQNAWDVLDEAWDHLAVHTAIHEEQYGDEWSSTRRQYELAFLAQLELDPEWEGSGPVKKRFIWQHLQREMDGRRRREDEL